MNLQESSCLIRVEQRFKLGADGSRLWRLTRNVSHKGRIPISKNANREASPLVSIMSQNEIILAYVKLPHTGLVRDLLSTFYKPPATETPAN